MGIRSSIASAARSLADKLGKPSFAGTPFPDGGVEKPAQLTTELGGTGTFNFGGFIRGEDFNPAMDAQTAIVNLDEMRRSDSQVHAALEVVKQPIRTADYELDPSDPDDPAAQEIAEFVKWNLFEGMVTTWDDVIRQALLMLDFGFMLFEKVWTVAEDGPYRGKIVLHKLAARPPRTIWQWFTDEDGGLISIKQLAVKAGTYQFLDVPASKLVRFTFQQEGDNFTGISMLRSAYPHWLIKKNLYLIDAIRATRFGVGIPRAKLKAGYKPTEEDKSAIALMLQGLSSHQHAYLIEPEQMDVDILMPQGVQGGAQLLPSINHQNEQITRNILAQFLDMGGKSAGGSRALGASAMDFFLNAIESIADQLCDVINKQLIKDLVDMNFSDVKAYPTLRPVGIQETDVKSMAAAAAALAGAGLLSADKKTENTFRNLMNLPEIAEDAPGAGDLQNIGPDGQPVPGAPAPPAAPGQPPAPAPAAPPAAPAKSAVPPGTSRPATTTVTAPAPAASTVTQVTPAASTVTTPTSATSTVTAPAKAVKAPNVQQAEMAAGAAPADNRQPLPAYRVEPGQDPTATLTMDVNDPDQPAGVSREPQQQPPQPPQGVAGRPIAAPDEAPQTGHDPRGQTTPAKSTWTTPLPARSTAYGTRPADTNVATPMPATSQVRAPQAAVSTMAHTVPATAHMARSSTTAPSGAADGEGHTLPGRVAAREHQPTGVAWPAVPATTEIPMSAMPSPKHAVALATKRPDRWTMEDGLTTLWRAPSMLETQVLDLHETPRRLDTARNALLATLRGVREEQILRIASAVAHTDRPSTVKAPLVGKLASDIVKSMQDTYDYGYKKVGEELRKQRVGLRQKYAEAYSFVDPIHDIIDLRALVSIVTDADSVKEKLEKIESSLSLLHEVITGMRSDDEDSSPQENLIWQLDNLYSQYGLVKALPPDAKGTADEINSLAGNIQNLARTTSAPDKFAQKEVQKLVASAEVSAQGASDKLLSQARQEALRLQRAGWDADEIEDALTIHLGELSDADISRIANQETNEAFSMGRVAASKDFKESIERAVYSAILDNNVCPVCEALDGEEFDVDSDEYEENMPPNANCEGGDQCRCTYIYLLKDDGADGDIEAHERRVAKWRYGYMRFYESQPRALGGPGSGPHKGAGKTDPHLVAQQRLTQLTMYHGTSTEAWKSIQKEGLIPHKGKGGDAWAAANGYTNISKFDVGERHASVFMSPAREESNHYAALAAHETGGKPLMLEIHIPQSAAANLHRDEHDAIGARYEGKIPPEWISKASGPPPPDTLPRMAYAPPSMRHAEGAGSATTLYAVMMCDAGQS